MNLTPQNKKTLKVLAIAGIVLIVAGVAVQIKKTYDKQLPQPRGEGDTGFDSPHPPIQPRSTSPWDVLTGVIGGIFGGDVPKTLPKNDSPVIYLDSADGRGLVNK